MAKAGWVGGVGGGWSFRSGIAVCPSRIQFNVIDKENIITEEAQLNISLCCVCVNEVPVVNLLHGRIHMKFSFDLLLINTTR